jgi:hypothetical protein
MKVVLRFMLHRLRLRRSRKLDKQSQSTR